MDPIANFAHAVDVANQVFSGVSPGQWTAQSPCSEWDARGVANHLVGGAKMLSTCLPGNEFDHAALTGDLLGDDPAAAFRTAADEAIAAFRADPSVLGRTVKLPFGEMPGGAVAGIFTTDVFTHAWDLAKATGQNTDLDPAFAEGVLMGARAMVSDAFRKPGMFDAEQPAPAGASAADKLAAFLGRKV